MMQSIPSWIELSHVRLHATQSNVASPVACGCVGWGGAVRGSTRWKEDDGHRGRSSWKQHTNRWYPSFASNPKTCAFAQIWVINTSVFCHPSRIEHSEHNPAPEYAETTKYEYACVPKSLVKFLLQVRCRLQHSLIAALNWVARYPHSVSLCSRRVHSHICKSLAL